MSETTQKQLTFNEALKAVKQATTAQNKVATVLRANYSKPAIMTPKGMERHAKNLILTGEVVNYDQLVSALGAIIRTDAKKEVETKFAGFEVIAVSKELAKQIETAKPKFEAFVNECIKDAKAFLQSDIFKQFAAKSFSEANVSKQASKASKAETVNA